jgi:hypothetical protein
MQRIGKHSYNRNVESDVFVGSAQRQYSEDPRLAELMTESLEGWQFS